MDKVSRRIICRQESLADKDVRAEQDEANWNSTDMQVVPISWKCRTGKVQDAAITTVKIIGHADEIVKVR